MRSLFELVLVAATIAVATFAQIGERQRYHADGQLVDGLAIAAGRIGDPEHSNIMLIGLGRIARPNAVELWPRQSSDPCCFDGALWSGDQPNLGVGEHAIKVRSE